MYILFDIGGTHLRITTADNFTKIRASIMLDTPRTYSDIVKTVIRISTEQSGKKQITGVAGSIAGSMDSKDNVVRSRNITQIIGKPFSRDLAKALHAPVKFINDAIAGGLGECTYGAGKGSKICAYITVGTGIGGARFIYGAIDAYSHSFEPGKQYIQTNNELATWGSLASGKAIESQTGKRPSNITNTAFWNKEAKLLAIGLHNTLMHWTPDRVVFGGGIVLTTKLSLQKVTEELIKITAYKARIPEIKKAKLGDASPLWGCLALLQQNRK